MSVKKKWTSFILGSALILCFFLLLSVGTNEIITVIAENKPISSRRTIIIDAGHGGEDGGATSCSGILESQFNLEISIKLNDLMHLLGIKTVMIRTGDYSVYTQGSTLSQKKVSDLKKRVAVVNQYSDGILISIHQNIFSDSRYHGAQVFYAPASSTLASQMQSNLIRYLNKDSNRTQKPADSIYLMQNIHCEGILIECGFLSNPEEEKMLRSEEYQKRLCCVIGSTVSEFLYADPSVT